MDEQTTPVLVGVAQVEQRIQTYTAEAKEPFDLMMEAVAAAAEDAGAPDVLEKASGVRVVRGAWPYKDPGRAIAQAIGAPGAETAITQYGGNFVQTTVNRSCLDIQSGRHDVIVITGAECGNSKAKARKTGGEPEWQALPGEPDLVLGDDVRMVSEFELEMQLLAPIQWYPIFETALRAHNGEAPDAHLKRISELWHGFSKVAATNPHARLRDVVSPEDIRTISPSNRAISYPYPKLMNSNNSVDMGAALILTSVAKAKQLGIPEDKWIYPHAGTDAHDTYFVSERDNLYSSPAIRIAGQRALELAGMTPSDVDHVDVYSCFPVAVQVGAREIGLPLDRPLTVTGGLTFNGGPLNNYVMHSIARMAEILRDEPGKRGMITANGGMLTKHAFGIYSTQPPEQPFQHQDVQAEVDAQPTRQAAPGFVGEAEVEGYVVMYGPDGPNKAWAACLTPDGDRTWATTEAPDVLVDMMQVEYVGKTGKVNTEHEIAF